MSSVSEQDHLNPRDPLYYAPRWLRERSASFRDGDRETALTPVVTFDSRLENAVSNALRHPLDPEVMREPEQEKKALWSVAARFGAAIGVAAIVALFFVIVVPSARQGDGDRPLRGSRSRSRRRCSSPARLRRSPPSTSSRRFSPPLRPAPPRLQIRRENCSSNSCSGARSPIRQRRSAPTHDPSGGRENA